jgi:hypothetical protein
MFSAIPRNSITSARASISSYPPSLLATRMARFYRVNSSIIVNIRSVLPSCVIHALPVGLGLYSARFNFAILRARLALASLHPCLWHLPAVPSVSTFPVGRSNQALLRLNTKETQKEKEATTIRLAVFAGLGVRKRPTPGACSDWLDIIRRQKSRIAHQRCKAEESSRGGPRQACADSPLTTESETKLPPERTLTRRPTR